MTCVADSTRRSRRSPSSSRAVLSDLIGDLTWSPNPVEIKLFSTDQAVLEQEATEVGADHRSNSRSRRRQRWSRGGRTFDADSHRRFPGGTRRFHPAWAGHRHSNKYPGHRLILRAPGRPPVRRACFGTGQRARKPTRPRLTPGPLRYWRQSHAPGRGAIDREPGILELHREDLRQLVAVSARFSGIDLGHGIDAIKRELAKNTSISPSATIEFGGLYQQQQQSFRNLTLVLVMAIVLVFGVLLLEFRRFVEPLAIVMGSVLALSGAVVAFWLTGTTLNIISLLGAIIGVGITAKNGILMLDFVDHLRSRGLTLTEALIQSGSRRLRPVLMTSLTAFLGLLPLAYGVGAGADMLRPMAVAVIGSLFMSLVMSLLATPLFFYLVVRSLPSAMTMSESVGQP